MSRDDLLRTNAGIVRSVGEQIAQVAPDAVVIVVSNPLDVMAYVAKEATGFPRERVIGMAGVLDTARFRLLHRHGAGRERRGHPGHGPGRTRRHHGAAGILHGCERHPRLPPHLPRPPRSAHRAHPQRRRRDRRLPQDGKRLLRPVRGGGADGRVDRQEQASDTPRGGVPRGRVRPGRDLPRRALQAGRGWSTGGRRGGTHRERGRGAGKERGPCAGRRWRTCSSPRPKPRRIRPALHPGWTLRSACPTASGTSPGPPPD